MLSINLKHRARAAGLHLLISLVTAALAALLVFEVWYPGAFRLLAGGRELFFLVTSVDVVLGPVLTFAVFDLSKGWPHLRRDLAMIVVLQTAALGYGLHTVYAARPVAMVFEVDRFRLVTATDVSVDELPQALPQYRQLSLSGPLLLGTRSPELGAERNDALFMGIAGIDIGQRPKFWQPYEQSVGLAVAKSRPIAVLLKHYFGQAAELKRQLHEMDAEPSSSRFLPVMARGDWVAVLSERGKVRGYLQVDGFF